MTSRYRHLVLATALLALTVIVMGAYVRLSDAGLSCPDWPGCYGRLTVPRRDSDLEHAARTFPERPLVAHRAWKEMTHRYLAAALGLAILGLAVLAWRRRREPGQPVVLPVALVGLVVLQAALGMWTVTLSLKPIVVTVHLLGGMATFALLVWVWLHPQAQVSVRLSRQRLGAVAVVLVVTAQIALGGWTSANYAALACPDVPTCQTSWWPPMDFAEAFHPWRELGQTRDGSPLSAEALTAIHVVHRVGAMATLLVVGGFAAASLRVSSARKAGVLVLAVLLLQIGIGVSTVLMARPLSFAVAHNAVAALLLMTVLVLVRRRVVSPSDTMPVESAVAATTVR